MKNTSKKYKVVLLGSRPLAMRILEYFLKQKNIELVGVMTPDKDNKKWWKGNLYDEAIKRKVKVISEKEIEKSKPDVLFSINYTKIIPKKIAKKYRIINAHSLLPRFRGRNAVSWAIINARKDNYWKFGVTLHEIDEGIDTGKIIATSYFDIEEDDTAKSLYRKWEKNCFNLIKKMLPDLLSGNYQLHEQKGKSYYYDRDSIKNKEINLDWDKNEIYDRIRAYTFPPFERPFIKLNNRKIYLVFRKEKKDKETEQE